MCGMPVGWMPEKMTLFGAEAEGVGGGDVSEDE